MNPEPKINKLRALFDVLTIATFLGLLWLPTVDHFLKVDHAPAPAENRRPATWPKFEGITKSRSFIAGIEDYFNDHFGFRKQLVRWNNHWKVQLFKDSSGREVLIGREGWLYHSGDRMFEHWTRQLTWNDKDLENWRQFLETRRDWLKSRNISYLFVVAPDKQTVYPEFLPAWLQQSQKPSKVQQLNAYLHGRSNVEFLDLSPSLIAAKQIRNTYLKTDTHWNLFGAFVGARESIAALAKPRPELHPLPLDDCEWNHVPSRPGQDLALLIGKPESFPETEAFDPVLTESFPKLEELRDTIRLPQQGARDTWPCITINTNLSGKAIVFGDSFSYRWHQILGHYFREVVFLRQADWDRALIEREKPDVVIEEIVERGFNLKNPQTLVRTGQLNTR